ncbi:MAG: leucyl/phenylalanyl-tRNA--protein transferase [Smithellaceae bacterium]|nr:leucyl/phenylalanyl-tRNA--protein transferase [Smithellaceae bacterium]
MRNSIAMPVFRITADGLFPPSACAAPGGALAIGGDLSPDRLLAAYSRGIFPWYSEDEPIIWWSPDPRFVLFPADLHVSKTMGSLLRKGTFEITIDKDFPAVISACKKSERPGQNGTWITDDMQEAYIRLHEMGFAHSVEAWRDDKLSGGLYGVSLGRCFFGESMFTHVKDASKAAFITLVQRLDALSFTLIDCQMPTRHLASLGAVEISRGRFLTLLEGSLRFPTLTGNWGALLPKSQKRATS